MELNSLEVDLINEIGSGGWKWIINMGNKIWSLTGITGVWKWILDLEVDI